MNKREVYRHLDDRNVRYEVTEHEAVYHMAEAAAVPLPYPEAKNLFVRHEGLLQTLGRFKRQEKL